MQTRDDGAELADRLGRLRPVLVTLAEALVSPQFRVELDASDLVQQTLLEAHREREMLGCLSEGEVYAWLRAALRHNVLDAVRHLGTQKNDARRRIRSSDLETSFDQLERFLAADETSPSQIAVRNEQITLMLAAIQELPVNQRKAVIMKHLQGCTLRELAESLAVSEAAAAGLLHRGRETLSRILQERGNA